MRPASSWRPLIASVVLAAGCGRTETDDTDTAPVETGETGTPEAFAVVEMHPADGDVDVPVDALVAVVLNRAASADTMTVQGGWGPCDATKSVLLSADGFGTCVGGSLSTTDGTQWTFATHGGLLSEARSYQLKLTTAVTDLEGHALAESAQHAFGFSASSPPCTAAVDPVVFEEDAVTTGAACVEPDFLDNTDGTVTDTANKLLWTKCSLDIDGVPMNGTEFGCVKPEFPNDYPNWETAVTLCDTLELAGRTDWTLPDVARLNTLVANSGDPAIDEVFFPNTANVWYSSSSTKAANLALHSSIIFGASGLTGPGYGGKIKSGGLGAGHVRCVAGTRAPVHR